jgi:hypothetical protein
LSLEDARGDELAIAGARATLAEAYLDAGKVEEAETEARQAHQELTALNHPARATSGFTLALTGWKKEQSSSHYFEEAMQVWAEAPLMLPAVKARIFESTAERFDRAGLPEEAARCRDAARQQWHRLAPPGFDSIPTADFRSDERALSVPAR